MTLRIAVSIWIGVHEPFGDDMAEVTFYVDTWTPFFENPFARVKAAWNILVHGVNKQEHDFILNRQAAINFADAINKTVRKNG